MTLTLFTLHAMAPSKSSNPITQIALMRTVVVSLIIPSMFALLRSFNTNTMPALIAMIYNYSPAMTLNAKNSAHPSLFLSMIRGATDLMYVHVHMRRRMTRRRDWKLNKADCRGASSFT